MNCTKKTKLLSERPNTKNGHMHFHLRTNKNTNIEIIISKKYILQLVGFVLLIKEETFQYWIKMSNLQRAVPKNGFPPTVLANRIGSTGAFIKSRCQDFKPSFCVSFLLKRKSSLLKISYTSYQVT